jgi:S-ribosylhomocysteine lyase LuxS involved in autoinducer biosynthesis
LKIKLNVLITLFCTGFLFFGCSTKSYNQLFEKEDKNNITKKIKKSFKLVINKSEEIKIEVLDEKHKVQKKYF